MYGNPCESCVFWKLRKKTYFINYKWIENTSIFGGLRILKELSACVRLVRRRFFVGKHIFLLVGAEKSTRVEFLSSKPWYVSHANMIRHRLCIRMWGLSTHAQHTHMFGSHFSDSKLEKRIFFCSLFWCWWGCYHTFFPIFRQQIPKPKELSRLPF